jgi:hypothetical protein
MERRMQMSPRQIASLAFKLAGLYALINAIHYCGTLAYYVYLLASPSMRTAIQDELNSEVSRTWLSLITTASTAAMYVAMGIVLIVCSRRFAARMFPEDPSESARTEVFAVQAVAFSIVGLALMAMSIPHLTNSAQYLLTSASSGTIRWSWAVPDLAGVLLRMGLGVALFFGGPGLARYWAKLRYTGLRRKLGLCARCGYDLTGNTTGFCPECGERTEAEPDATRTDTR